MSTNNSYGRGPLHSRSWDEREEPRNKQQQDDYTGWGSAGARFWRDDNHHGGGFTGAPGSHYAAGRFGGAGQGTGIENDPYRGYYGSGPTGGEFAASYTHSYDRDDYRTEEQRHRERSGSYGYEDDRRHRESYDWNRVQARPESDRRREAGPHRGKGPKNYKRPDDRIREDVSDRLADDPYVDASDIDIKVEDGNVILSGRVDHRDARRRAVELAEGVRGVSNVESHLRTGQGMMENLSHAVTAAIGDVTLGPDVSTVDTPKKGRKRKGLL